MQLDNIVDPSIKVNQGCRSVLRWTPATCFHSFSGIPKCAVFFSQNPFSFTCNLSTENDELVILNMILTLTTEHACLEEYFLATIATVIVCVEVIEGL